MKLASYVGTRNGFMGLANRLIRLRLSGLKEALKTDKSLIQAVLRSSHSEIVFEPGDGVDNFMPDGTCNPNEKGELWCASSTGFDIIPSSSIYRAGKCGGVRFKRINVNTHKWELTEAKVGAFFAAIWAVKNQGMLYDWQLVFSFLNWLVPQNKSRVMCSEACAEMLGFIDAHRYDPCTLQSAVTRLLRD